MSAYVHSSALRPIGLFEDGFYGRPPRILLGSNSTLPGSVFIFSLSIHYHHFEGHEFFGVFRGLVCFLKTVARTNGLSPIFIRL